MMLPADRRLACLIAASAAAHLMVLSATGWHARSPVSSGDTELQVSLLAPALEQRTPGSISVNVPPTKAASATAPASRGARLKSIPATSHATEPQLPTTQVQFKSSTPDAPAPRGEGGRSPQNEAAIQAYGQTLHDRLMQAVRARFVYPLLARREGWQGAVRLLLHIDPDGRISNTRIVRTSGYAILDQAAVRSVREVAAVRVDDAPPGTAFFDLSLTVVYRLTDG